MMDTSGAARPGHLGLGVHQGSAWQTLQAFVRQRVVSRLWFDYLVLAVVVGNCVTLAVEPTLAGGGRPLSRVALGTRRKRSVALALRESRAGLLGS
jgi:hypothetical protein